MRRRLRPLLPILLLCLLASPVLAQEAQYGQTTFPNSGDETAQAPFLQGVLMLHSFEYEEARAAFQEAQSLDPDFAMAHWGEAMTHNHPVWMEQDRAAALDALRDLAPTPEARLDEAPTEREKAYLRTLHTLYGAGADDPASKQTRDDAYEAAMAELAEQYPDDLDAQAFHALSILGTAHEGRDFATYMRAAAQVEEVFDENPEHPGAAHYLIHAYDDPVHAPLGLRPARVYADIAPSAPHALHMPSHIFFALGLWERGAESNVASFEAARRKAGGGADGLSGGGFHALHWLHYARLQQGRHEAARAVLDTTRHHAQTPATTTGYADYMRWYMPISYVVETQQWDQLEALLDEMAVAPGALDERGAVSVYAAQGLAAARQDRLSDARSTLEKAQSALGDDPATALTIQVRELEGLLALKTGDTAAALEHLQTATELETERPLDYGPPFPVKPAPELYGEALLAADRPADALAQFETTLERYPDRALALESKARAAAQADRPDAAQAARSALSEQWSGADASVRSRLQALSAATDAE